LYRDNVVIARFLLAIAYPREPDIQEHHVRSLVADPQQHTIFL